MCRLYDPTYVVELISSAEPLEMAEMIFATIAMSWKKRLLISPLISETDRSILPSAVSKVLSLVLISLPSVCEDVH